MLPDLVEERVQITQFLEEGEVERGMDATTADQFSHAAADSMRNDVVGFLQRPVHLKDFQWVTTQNRMSEIVYVDLPENWIQNNMILQKLQGFTFCRADFFVRVQVNAMPFNGGRLIIWYEPFARQKEMRGSSTRHMGGITGYSHVDLDLREETVVELKVPWISTISHLNLAQGFGALGRVHVYVYSPLTGSAASDEVDGTIWVRAENVDMQMPTAMPVRMPNAQMGLQEEKKQTTISGIARAAGSIARKVQGIPIIGSYASTTAAVSDAVAGIASAFGFSKPTDDKLTRGVQTVEGRYLSNFNGNAITKQLALDARNEVKMPLSLNRGDEDEMAINALLSKPNFVSAFRWDKTQNTGTNLWKWPVTPSACNVANSTTPANYQVFFETYLSYTSNLFQGWNGTIIYDFYFVATQFHSGRVEISFIPGATLATDLSTLNTDYVYKTIVDVRETTKFSLEIPFVHHAPWQNTRVEAGYIGQERGPPTGLVLVKVLNALRTAAAASDAIEVLVETRAGKDFNYCMPMVSDSHIQPIQDDEVIANAPVYYQAYNEPNAHIGPFMPAPKRDNVEVGQQGPGEVITSFRQLLKRYRLVNFASTTQSFSIAPYSSPYHYLPVAPNKKDFDVFGWIMFLYRFMSGGMRVAVSEVSNDSPAILYTLDHVLADRTTGPFVSGDPIAVQNTMIEPFIEIGVPFYQMVPAILTRTDMPRDVDVSDLGMYDAIPNNPGHSVSAVASSPTSVRAFCAIAEDFNFHYPIGVPLTTIIPDTS